MCREAQGAERLGEGKVMGPVLLSLLLILTRAIYWPIIIACYMLGRWMALA